MYYYDLEEKYQTVMTAHDETFKVVTSMILMHL